MDTWNKLLETARVEAEDTSAIVAKAPDDPTVWDHPFDGGYGLAKGQPVLAWTADRVYFPVVYDGAEWMDSAPRNPVEQGQEHVGGG